ncbi:MAG: response regulator [Bacteroidales bacterium]
MSLMTGKNRVLVVDDDPILLRRLRELLVRNNYRVETASSGGVGVQKVFEFRPHLIICDISMGDLSGYEVFNILKRSKVVYTTSFIFLTGSEDPKEQRMGMFLGVDDYLKKPIDNEELLLAVKTRLQKKIMLKSIMGDHFNQLVNMSPNMVLGTDFSGKLHYYNEAFTSGLDYTNAELKSKNLSKLLDDDSLKTMKKWIELASKGVEREFSGKVRLIAKNGSLYHAFVKGVYLQASTLLDANVYFLFQKDEGGENKLNKSKKDLQKIGGKPLAAKDYLVGNVVVNEENINIKLSKREREVLELSCQGYTIKEIASKLFISDRTVEKHRAQLMSRLSARNFIEVILFAIKHRIIEL